MQQVGKTPIFRSSEQQTDPKVLKMGPVKRRTLSFPAYAGKKLYCLVAVAIQVGTINLSRAVAHKFIHQAHT